MSMIPAAAGYQRYAGVPFVPPIVSAMALRRFIEDSLVPQITSGDYLGELPAWGGTLLFKTRGRARVRDSVIGSTIKHDQYSRGSRSITVGGSLESSHYIDHLDADMAGAEWTSFLSEITESVMEQYDQSIQSGILNSIPYILELEGAPHMFGATAGKISKAYNLGITGAPLSITSATIITILTYVKGVMREANLPVDSETPYILMPSIAETLILNSELRLANVRGNNQESMLVSGRPLGNIAGINIYINNRVPSVYDAGVNATCYQCIFGFPWAMAFAGQIVENRIISENPDSWLTYHQTRYVHTSSVVNGQGTTIGAPLLYPEALGMVYARFA